jgi:hypothetical protein
MNMGAITWTCLLLAGQATAATEVWHLNQMRFKIPVVVYADRRPDVQTVHLYVSHDEGKSWNQELRMPASGKEFIYQAQGDGVLWFIVTTVDSHGAEEPADVYKVPPEKIQRIVVDTRRPEVRITTAERRGSDVFVAWQIQEQYPDPASLRVEFRTPTMPESQWLPVNVLPGAQQASFRPDRGDLLVRVQIRDRAGNQGEDRSTVTASATVAGNDSPSSADSGRRKVEPAGGVAPKDAGAGSRGAGATGPSVDGAFPPSMLTPTEVSTSLSPRNPGRDAGRTGSSSPSAGAATGPAGLDLPPPPGVGGHGRDTDAAPGSVLPGDPPKTVLGGERSPLAGMTKGSLGRMKIVRKNRVKLDFDVTRLGPSGVGGVEVYVTTDEGATWAPAAYDQLTLPQEGEVAQTGPMRGSVMVTLPREGTVFGFYLIVKSRAGLGKPPPQRGDPPHVRLELDSTGPLAALYKPEPDRDHANALVLRWKAWDRNPSEHPVKLEYAENRDGPWTRIADGLANKIEVGPVTNPSQLEGLPFTGSYVWQLPARIPPKVYLKMSVTDAVGNVTVAQTPEPILIDLIEPVVDNVSAGN